MTRLPLFLLGLTAALTLLTGCHSKKWNDFFGRDEYGHDKSAARRRNATADALTPARERRTVAEPQQRSSRRQTGGPLDWVRPNERKGNAFGGSGLSEDERTVINRLDNGTGGVTPAEARELDRIREENRKASKEAQRSIF